MIDSENALAQIKDNFPDFFSSQIWQNHLEFWGDDKPRFGHITSTFSDYAKSLFKAHKMNELKKIFDFTEVMVELGDETVQTAFTTQFLENLLNIVPDQIPAQDFVPLLGKESRAYCKAWDDFTGVRTEGLHD